MIEINKIHNESNLETMKRMPDGFVDLVVTSPPYDNLREYNGFVFPFEETAKELFRIIKPGGVVMWNVSDATINGSETGTSFRQALFFIDCGFKLHDTMIYEKNSTTFPSAKNSTRYSQIFEFCFVFVKGEIKTANLICDKANKYAGQKDFAGKLKNPVPEFSPRNNIFKYTTSQNDKTTHPAVMPEKLAADHIHTWSNEGDLVYDPFMGSGTTAKMSHIHKRNWIGSEISEEYVKIANNRLKPYLTQTTLF